MHGFDYHLDLGRGGGVKYDIDRGDNNLVILRSSNSNLKPGEAIEELSGTILSDLEQGGRRD